jgi:hypothetical protein
MSSTGSTSSSPAFTASSSAELGLTDLSLNSATISGMLNVLGRTTVTDLGITGHLTTGVLGINGLDDDGLASINTIGTLKLQDHLTGGLDILSGKITIDTDGNMLIKESITAKTVTTQKLNITTDTTASSSATLSASAGVSTMTTGIDTLTIQTSAITTNSLIYITFQGNYSPALRYWTDGKVAGKSFTVHLDAPVANSVKFNWWIVN